MIANNITSWTSAKAGDGLSSGLALQEFKKYKDGVLVKIMYLRAPPSPVISVRSVTSAESQPYIIVYHSIGLWLEI